ncbi:NADP-dependent oxidoreductase domain protein [Cordyceps fumosorosea ARSEF 2679]|uniref:NADP-dependent oxidoreductase domain protein n=1 Tax=Cordyceps fumosorosea (strain ARSEF 2679) TaxID=1081104 RepID=A0A167S6G8_CORFA|nr:NADP-dependent oxidoreductase domain protein [Cordyceps fumosorosea ARSEF 2679]OAA59306.1 NADP-dependent oxidoreductase domain protein [Cordyceps fumosorosea ARSEF 2679]
MTQPSIGAQASRFARDFTLNGVSRTRMPKLVYGTAWKKDKTANLVYTALKAGFRGIDTAAQPKHYDEPGVAAGFRKAVSEGIVKRGDVFIQTKFTPPGGQNDNAPYDFDASIEDKVHQSVQSSLLNFTIEGEEVYLDSVVLHSPLDTLNDTIAAWKTLEGYHPHKIRNLGISNATLGIVEALHSRVTVKPAVVQNRFYPDTNYEVGLRAFCKEHDIKFQSFWTIGANPHLVKSQPVIDVVDGAGVGPVSAYYALVMGLEGVTILDGTTKEVHMKEDLEGLERVGTWADGDGAATWEKALGDFKELIEEP